MLSSAARKLIRTIKAKAKVGDRAGVISLCDVALEPPPPRPPPPGQSILAMNRLIIHPAHVIVCRTLGCEVLPAGVCVARQVASEVQRTKDTWRGNAGDYPHCVTEKCAQGRAVREALDPTAAALWKGEGAGGRIVARRSRKELAAQEKARSAKERVGLLDEVRVVDVHPDPAGEEG